MLIEQFEAPLDLFGQVSAEKLGVFPAIFAECLFDHSQAEVFGQSAWQVAYILFVGLRHRQYKSGALQGFQHMSHHSGWYVIFAGVLQCLPASASLLQIAAAFQQHEDTEDICGPGRGLLRDFFPMHGSIVLHCEADFRTDQDNAPIRIKPAQEEWECGEGAIDGIVFSQSHLQHQVCPVHCEPERAGDQSGGQGRKGLDRGIGHKDVEEGEAAHDKQGQQQHAAFAYHPGQAGSVFGKIKQDAVGGGHRVEAGDRQKNDGHQNQNHQVLADLARQSTAVTLTPNGVEVILKLRHGEDHRAQQHKRAYQAQGGEAGLLHIAENIHQHLLHGGRQAAGKQALLLSGLRAAELRQLRVYIVLRRSGALRRLLFSQIVCGFGALLRLDDLELGAFDLYAVDHFDMHDLFQPQAMHKPVLHAQAFAEREHNGQYGHHGDQGDIGQRRGLQAAFVALEIPAHDHADAAEREEEAAQRRQGVQVAGPEFIQKETLAVGNRAADVFHYAHKLSPDRPNAA